VAVSLDQLRTFLAVYRCGSFTVAAATLGMSQPAVTAQIKALESAVGRPLFDRLPRGVAPTPFADALAQRLAGPLDELDVVVGRELGGADTVLLGGPAEVMCTHVAASLTPVVEQGTRVRMVFGVSDDLLDDLAAGRLDLVVSTVRPRRRGIRVDALADEEFVMVAAPDVAAAVTGASRPDPASLAKLRWVAYAEDLPIIRRYWRTVFGVRPELTAALVVPDLRGILAAVVAGAGASVLPSFLCAEDIAAGRLTRLADPEIAPLNTAFLAARAAAVNRPAVAAVREHLISFARTQIWS
jgi:DNA-binding transcriptional LysR family regulator